MSNIIDYALTEKRSFADFPLNRVDSLIFSQIAYVNFAAVLPNLQADQFYLKLNYFQQKALLKEEFASMFQHVWQKEKSGQLLLALAKSPRFSQIKLNFYVEELDQKNLKQFSALSFLINEKQTYIAFRGTDDSVIGWHESLNMTYLHVTASHQEAAAYLKKVTSKTKGELFIGGHSKGGSLATYASLMLPLSAQKRIAKIYNHDGPGLNKDWWQHLRTPLIAKKIDKTIPRSSLIGKLLDDGQKYQIVKSRRFGLMQHDPFSWLVKNGDFVQSQKESQSVNKAAKSLSVWLKQIPPTKRAAVIDIFFQVLQATDITNLHQLQKIDRKKFGEILRHLKNIDSETKELIKTLLKKLLIIYFAKNK